LPSTGPAASGPAAASAARDPRERRAWCEVVGALIADASLIPLARAHVDRCPEADLARIVAAVLDLCAREDAAVDAGSVLNLLGDDAARDLVVPLVERTATAESPRVQLEGALRCLRTLELEAERVRLRREFPRGRGDRPGRRPPPAENLRLAGACARIRVFARKSPGNLPNLQDHPKSPPSTPETPRSDGRQDDPAEKIEETIKLLVEEGRKKGFLTYTEMNRLLEDQFVPPDKMDAIFLALEDSGSRWSTTRPPRRRSRERRRGAAAVDADDGCATTTCPRRSSRGGLPEKIDDPVRMYLTQMGEIPLLTRDQEIYLAKTIEITASASGRRRWLGPRAARALKTLEEVERGELAFDRTLKVNPNPKPDDDPEDRRDAREELPREAPAVQPRHDPPAARADPRGVPAARRGTARRGQERSERLEVVQALRRKLVILVEECHLQVKKVRPYMDVDGGAVPRDARDRAQARRLQGHKKTRRSVQEISSG
jgi:hypothetical protein